MLRIYHYLTCDFQQHWHKEAEWAYVLEGEVHVSTIDVDGGYFIDDLKKGDLWYFLSRYPHCWIAGRPPACPGGSIQNHKNKDSLYGRKSLESGRVEQIVYRYRASPTVRSIDFIIPTHHSQKIHSTS
jgi:hypothetical protein